MELTSAVFQEFHCGALFMVNTLHPTTFYQSGVSLSALRAYLLLLHYIQTLLTAQLKYLTALLTHTHTHKNFPAIQMAGK